MKNDIDAELAVDVVSVLFSSLKKYHKSRGTKNDVVVSSNYD